MSVDGEAHVEVGFEDLLFGGGGGEGVDVGEGLIVPFLANLLVEGVVGF